MKMIRSRKVPLAGTVLAVLAAGLMAAAAQAQIKIATLDLRKVFDNYWKTKQADAQLKERASDLDKARKGMIEDYQKANEEYKKLIDGASDQALSDDERDKRKSAAEKKHLEIKEIEQSINAFDKTSRTTLGEQQRRMRENILREIREFVEAKAKGGGYGLVLDTSAESFNNQTSIFLYSTSENDLTDAVLSQLNANAPVGALKPDSDKEKSGDSKDEKPAEKK
jgi:outer membrane protein